MTFREYAEQFHSYLLTEKRVSQNTFDAYRRDLAQFIAYCDEQRLVIEQTTKKHISAFLKTLKQNNLTARSIARKISTLKRFFSYLHTTFKVNDISAGLSSPKLEQRLPEFLTELEVQRLLESANQDVSLKGVRNKVMLYLMYASGLRVTELVSLQVHQVHFDTGFLQLMGKGKKERHVPLPRNMLDLLRSYIDLIRPHFVKHVAERSDQLYLFPVVYRSTTKAISRQLFWLMMKKLLILAGFTRNVSPHSLRHSLATHLLKNGADIRSLQLLLGHESLATIQIYTHLGKDDIRKIYDEKHPRA